MNEAWLCVPSLPVGPLQSQLCVGTVRDENLHLTLMRFEPTTFRPACEVILLWVLRGRWNFSCITLSCWLTCLTNNQIKLLKSPLGLFTQEETSRVMMQRLVVAFLVLVTLTLLLETSTVFGGEEFVPSIIMSMSFSLFH